jgi:hypothetical protein
MPEIERFDILVIGSGEAGKQSASWKCLASTPAFARCSQVIFRSTRSVHLNEIGLGVLQGHTDEHPPLR